MFYTAAEVLPREDKTAQRLGAVSDRLFRNSRKDFNIRVGDYEIRYTHSPRFVLLVDRPATLRRLLLRPNHYAAAEAFVDRRLDIEGDLLEGLRMKNALAERAATLRAGEKLKLALKLALI